MGKLKLFWVLCVLGTWVVAKGATPSNAPSPSVDCSAVLLSMADCLTFVMNGSTISKPEGSCCSGFKTVLKDDPKCLCEAFNNNNNLGIALNMTKASTLPSACAVSSTPPMSNCGFYSAPSDAPVPSPSPTAALQLTGSPSNPTSTGAPKQSQSNAAAISISVAAILASLTFSAETSWVERCKRAVERSTFCKGFARAVM
ncbi:non-specific lipid-transfer protein-like protein [Cinnamomum micranthum f. kanehirae]|uniref:Non-specific lipid-transfer protein-like protein n=1 Tax=Cinnamomum micranthum f. kanehirae TaxID=337451 RepID=A0A443NIU7_9MAGN|nr:non-specific lipid-transfer protein-like protein [Cinnamomum micranthum f. kanehirae]